MPIAARFLIGLLLSSPALVFAQLPLPDMIVRANRLAPGRPYTAFATTAIDQTTLHNSPAATLDGVLRSVPSFGLFRRSDSFSANPTAQGVSLRGLGPSGASRSLVLLDGVPLNDPFGGWVSWSKIPRESLASVEIVRGGGATNWGNAALGGTLHLITEAPSTTRGRLAASYGSFNTHSAEFALSHEIDETKLQILGRDFSTDGFSLVAPEDRGAIDQAAASEHRWLRVRGTRLLNSQLSLTATVGAYREERNNGTPFQKNSSREHFASVRLASVRLPSFAWNATAYVQRQTFASTFSSVDATRATETPASDQFDVPATAFGATWTGTWHHGDAGITTFGLDYRTVRGETREHFSYSAGEFTRLRVAGGTQTFTGFFAQHEHTLTSKLRATFGGRFDYWRDSDGQRRESELATGVFSRRDTYAAQHDIELSPSVGLVWTDSSGWRVRSSVQHAFRRPTLNELYRPFRVGNVITEPNADLATERVLSAEIGIDYIHPRFDVSSALFHNDLRDAVSNITLERGPGTFPLFGFIPAGGVGRQRLNLERVEVRGAEFSTKLRVTSELSLTFDYLYNESTVRRAALAPDLIGKRLAQVPRHTATFGVNWQLTSALALTPRVRWISRQFEDDENQLILGEVVIVDLGLRYTITPRVELFASAENLTDARIETGRTAAGLVNTGTPRLLSGGLRFNW